MCVPSLGEIGQRVWPQQLLSLTWTDITYMYRLLFQVKSRCDVLPNKMGGGGSLNPVLFLEGKGGDIWKILERSNQF